MNNNKTIQALWVGVGAFSTFALSFVSAAILSRYFNKQDYGTYKQILFVYNSLLIVFSAGLPRVYSYFLPRYSLAEGKSIVQKIGIALAIAGIIFGAFLFFGANLIASALNNPDIEIGLRYFAIVPIFLFPSFGVEGIFASFSKTKYIAIYSTISRFIMLIFIVGPVLLFRSSFLYAIYGWVIVSVLSLIIAYYFKAIPFKGVKAIPTTLQYKSLLSYSLPIVTASLAGVAIKSSDQFYISRYFGSEVFAEFSNGFIDLPIVAMITGSTSAVLMPFFSRITKNGNNFDEISTAWRSALLKSAIIIYPLVVFFIFFAKDIVVLLYSDLYSNSAVYFQIALIVNFFNIIIFAPLLFSFGETRYYSTVHIFIAAVAWVGGAVVLHLFNSPVAIAIFSVMLSIFKSFMGMRKSAQLLQISIWNLFPLRELAPILLQSVVALITVVLLNNLVFSDFNDLFRITIIFAGYTFLILVSARFFGIDYLSLISPILKRVF